MDNNKEKALTYGKVVKLPKNTDIVNFMENVKIARDKHWYLLTEKEVDVETGKQLHLVKYNKEGVNANEFITQLKKHYIDTTTDENMKSLFFNIKVVGNDKFSVIKNIPDIEISDIVSENNKDITVKKSLISKITTDLIKLLRN